jgi:DNA-binding SARP family transcriptional activator
MKFRLLGPLEVWVGDDWKGIGAPKWRSVLAALLINAGQIVSADVLIDEVWGDAPPARAANLISIYVLRLRRLLGDADGRVLVTRAPGYQLRVAAADTDVLRFETMVRDGRKLFASGDAQGAAQQLTEALALWQGRPLADVRPTPLVEAETERLTELHLGALELRITAELASGGHDQAVPEIRRLLADHPLREGLWLQLMRALDGAGRHAEALEVYGQARTAISGQLGVDPGAELRQLHADLLAQDQTGLTGTISVGTVSAGPVPAGPLPAGPVPAGPVPARSRKTAAGKTRGSAAADAETAGTRPARGPRSAALAPAQLPADVADFTGRDEQVKHLSDLLAGSGASSDTGAVRVAVVAGAGGLGKTSLAIHAAHRVRRKFPDGQLYVDLLGATPTPLSPGDVLARFLRDLGVGGGQIPADEDERAGRYRTALAKRRMLVVLDNARDAAQVRPLLPGTASSAVLVTTRSRMPDLASTKLVDLNVLDDDEALTLFIKAVGGDRAAAEPEATAELLNACAGLPLAIRICAARLATRSGWTIQSMANRLRDVHRRLDELKVGDLAVRASFQVSFASLPASPDPQGVDPARAFCLLGLWQGPSVSVISAAALFGVSVYLAEDALEALVDAHLLESTTPDKYKFHDLLRVYAAERASADLSADDREAAIARLLDWYMRTADAAATVISPYRYDMPLDQGECDQPPLAFSDVDDALAWYDSARSNVIAAIRQAAESGLHDVAWRLPAPLLNIFERRASWGDCIATHRIALDSARRAGNRQGEAWVLNNLGYALGISRESEAIGYLEQALAIRREIGDKMGEAQAVGNLADVYDRLGRTSEAIELFQQARDLNRDVGNRYGEGVALINLGAAFLYQAHAEQAVGHLEQAHSTFSEIGYLDGVGYAMHFLGECHLALGRDSDAMDCLRQAVISHQASGSRYRTAVSLQTLGGVQARNGLAAQARQSWAQAGAIFDELGDLVQADKVRAEQVASGIS